jgi:signal peptidase I
MKRTLAALCLFLILISFGCTQEKFGEKPSPYNHIKITQIHIEEDKVVIDVKHSRGAEFTDTDSMDPIIDIGANAIQITPESSEDIHVGDIVSYRPEGENYLIVHRVIKIGEDNKGKYFIFKGDNNLFRDAGRIRFEQINRIIVGIIY